MATHIQSRASASTTADQSLAFSSNVTAGSLLVVFVREGSTSTNAPLISDTLGNTYTLAQRSRRNFIFVATSASGGANTVSVDSEGTTSTRLVIAEYGGTWPSTPTVSTSTAVQDPGSSPAASNSITPSQANGVALAMIGTISDANPFSVSSDYTIMPVASNRNAPAYRLVSSTAASTATYTTGAGISAGADLQNVYVAEAGGSTNAPRSMFYHLQGMR